MSGLLFLSGCGEYPGVEITTSDGEAIVTRGGYGNAAVMNQPIELKASSAKVHFFCTKCDHDEVMKLTAPEAKLFQCDCKSNPGLAAVKLKK